MSKTTLKHTVRLDINTYSEKKTIEIINTYCYDLFYRYALKENFSISDYNCNCSFTYIAIDRKTDDFIGYVNGYFPIPDNTLWIQTFLINKAYSRKGYGTEFYLAILDILRDSHQLDTVFLSCFDENITGNSFWKSLDFIKIDEKEKLLPTKTEPSIVNIFKKSMNI